MNRWWKLFKNLFKGNFIGVLHVIDCPECRAWLLQGTKRCFEK